MGHSYSYQKVLERHLLPPGRTFIFNWPEAVEVYVRPYLYIAPLPRLEIHISTDFFPSSPKLRTKMGEFRWLPYPSAERWQVIAFR